MELSVLGEFKLIQTLDYSPCRKYFTEIRTPNHPLSKKYLGVYLPTAICYRKFKS